MTLQQHQNERDDVSNHLRLDCLPNRLFGRKSKKTSNSASLAFVRGIHWWPVARHWPLWGETTGDRWIFLTKGQYLMTSSWRNKRCYCRVTANRLKKRVSCVEQNVIYYLSEKHRLNEDNYYDTVIIVPMCDYHDYGCNVINNLILLFCRQEMCRNFGCLNSCS